MTRRILWLAKKQPLASHQLLWRANNYYQWRLRAILGAHNVSYLEYAIMTELLAQPLGAAYSYTQLATDLHVGRKCIAAAVQSATAKRLARRYIHSPFDQRAWVVLATPVTAQKVKTINEAVQKIEDEVARMLGASGQVALRELCKTASTQPIPKARASWWRITHQHQTGQRRTYED